MELKITDSSKGIYGRITSAFRRMWMIYSSERKAKLKDNIVRRKNPKTGRYKNYNVCEDCGKLIENPQVHHTIPVGSLKDGADSFLTRLFCHRKYLKILCVECHNKIHGKKTKKKGR